MEIAALIRVSEVYWRHVLYVLPSILFRMFVGRMIPFLLCTSILVFYKKYTGKHLYIIPLVVYVCNAWVGMELTAFVRYWSGEFFSEVTRRLFPSLTYRNGSIFFENTLLFMDVFSFLYASVVSFFVDLHRIGDDMKAVFVVTVAMSLLSGILLSGFPGIRHFMWLVYIASSFLFGYWAFHGSHLLAVCIFPSLLLLVASFINDGASYFQYPSFVADPFKEYDTPSLNDTLSEIGVTRATAIVLAYTSNVLFIHSVSLLIGYFALGIFGYGIDSSVFVFMYFVYSVVVCGKFIVNDLGKTVIRRNLPFLLYPNGSFFVSTTIFGMLKTEFLSLVASILFGTWCRKSDSTGKSNFLGSSNGEPHFAALFFYLSTIIFTFILEFLHPIVTSLAFVVVIVVLFLVDYIKLGKDSNFLLPGSIAVCLVPWIYVFVRKEGMISWTTYIRASSGLLVTLCEIEAAENLNARAAENLKARAAENLKIDTTECKNTNISEVLSLGPSKGEETREASIDSSSSSSYGIVLAVLGI